MINDSFTWMKRAQQVIPGGVNSPVRAFANIDRTPKVIQRGEGPYIFDINNHRYIDYVASWGPLILGHSPPKVLAALKKIIPLGSSFGAPTTTEVKLAELIANIIPSIEMIRMVNSGTEATMSAIRLARGFTNRNKIIKFDGCYHGHCDSLLVKAGSGTLTLGIASSTGVPKNFLAHTLTAPFNNLHCTNTLFKKFGNDIAAIIVEPIAANMNLVLPTPDFLPGLRRLCDKYDSLLIFDEVITGFRVALGGAQTLYDVKPDLTCLGKIIGGGFPVGAFGGKKNIMSNLAPLGSVYQAGTLSGNPVALTAGLVTLQLLQSNPKAYTQLHELTHQLLDGLTSVAHKHHIQLDIRGINGLFGFKFTSDPKHKKFKSFFQNMLDDGIYLAPSPYESGFISLAHTYSIIEETIQAADRSFGNLEN